MLKVLLICDNSGELLQALSAAEPSVIQKEREETQETKYTTKIVT